MLLLKKKILDINKSVTDAGVQGVATLSHLDMLDLRNTIEQSESTTIYIEIVVDRAQCSGLLHDNGCIGRYVKRYSSSYHYGSFWSV
jgi:hypothetical protein